MNVIDLQLVTKPEVTIIQNSILDQYLPEANELQLKVYLYILRNLNAVHSIEISAMADYFNETEKDITRAIAFWQKRGVFSASEDSLEQAEAPQADTPAAAPVKEPAPMPEPSVSTNRPVLSVVSDSQDFGELRFVAEAYMGKPLTSNDLHILLFIRQNLGFSNELIDFLLQHCAECDKHSFHYVQKVACEWSRQGISTPEEAQSHCAMYNKRIYSIMNALGKKSEPTNAELDFINRWYQQYAFDLDVILEACKRTVLATDKNRFAYAEKILSSWHALDIHHLSDISRADASFQSQKKTIAPVRKMPSYVSNNPFLQHESTNVDYDALEKELLQQL